MSVKVNAAQHFSKVGPALYKRLKKAGGWLTFKVMASQQALVKKAFDPTKFTAKTQL